MIMRISAIALLTAIVGVCLSELGFRSKGLFSLLTLVIIFSSISGRVEDIISRMLELSSLSGVGDAVECIVKTVGAGYLFTFCSEVCQQLGEATLARAVTFAGRVEILIIAFPFFEKSIKLCLELIQ